MRVIERHGYTVDDAGRVHYDDREVSIESADRIAGRRLDRRRNYALIAAEVCESVTWTEPCSGCYEGYAHDGRGSGCPECGNTGRSRRSMWVPVYR